jgi:hypothetical protein
MRHLPFVLVWLLIFRLSISYAESGDNTDDPKPGWASQDDADVCTIDDQSLQALMRWLQQGGYMGCILYCDVVDSRNVLFKLEFGVVDSLRVLFSHSAFPQEAMAFACEPLMISVGGVVGAAGGALVGSALGRRLGQWAGSLVGDSGEDDPEGVSSGRAGVFRTTGTLLGTAVGYWFGEQAARIVVSAHVSYCVFLSLIFPLDIAAMAGLLFSVQYRSYKSPVNFYTHSSNHALQDCYNMFHAMPHTPSSQVGE